MINWEQVDEQYANNNFKEYAPEGTFKVKVVDATARQVKGGAYVMDFEFEEDDKYQYPKAGCFISKDKDNWRYHYVKNLFMVLGAPEDKSKQVIEKAEEKGDYDFAVKTYEASFKRLLQKKPETEINVYFSGNVSKKGNPINNSEFTDSRVKMKRKEEKVEAVVGDIEVIPTDDEIPF